MGAGPLGTEETRCLHQYSTCRCPSTGASPTPTISSVARMASGCTTGPTQTGVRPAVRADREVAGLMECGGCDPGRRMAELMDHWGGDHGGLPILVPSHRPPSPAAPWGYPLVIYVTDGIESAMEQTKVAAGDRGVQVRGAYTGQRALEAGVSTRCRSTWCRCCRGTAVGSSTAWRRSMSWRSSR